MMHWWPPALDRRAHWKAVECSDEEIANKARLSRLTWLGLALAALFTLSSCVVDDAAQPQRRTHESWLRKAVASVNLGAVFGAFLVDTYGSPPPAKGSDPWQATKTIGPLAYFTKQALCLQCTHAGATFVGEVLGRTTSCAAADRGATAVAVVALSLTLLFLKLNWFEETWQREAVDPWTARGLPIRAVVLVSHLLPAPVALLDLLFLRSGGGLLSAWIEDARQSAWILATYVLFYVGLTLLNARLNGGFFPYPFMRLFTTPTHWLLFTLAVLFFVVGVVLPFVLAVRALAASFSAFFFFSVAASSD